MLYRLALKTEATAWAADQAPAAILFVTGIHRIAARLKTGTGVRG